MMLQYLSSAAVVIGALRVNSITFRVILHALLTSADFFSNSTVLKSSFMNTIRVPKSLDPDKARHFVGPDLGANCLQRLSADNKICR